MKFDNNKSDKVSYHLTKTIQRNVDVGNTVKNKNVSAKSLYE